MKLYLFVMLSMHSLTVSTVLLRIARNAYPRQPKVESPADAVVMLVLGAAFIVVEVALIMSLGGSSP